MTTSYEMSPQEALSALHSLDATEIDAMEWEPVPDCPGVTDKVLWRFDDFVQALIRYEPGATSPGRPHYAAHHHLWVVSGSASVAGRLLTAGSYMHVPPRTLHPVTDVGPDGFVVLQMHRPHGPKEAERVVFGA